MSTNSSQAATSSELIGSGGPLVIDGISYIPSSVLLTGIPKLTFKDNHAFGVVDSRGDAPRLYTSASELGIYYNDTRYLSTWEFNVNDSAPVALSHELRFGGSTVVLSMTNRDLTELNGSGRIPRDSFLIRRVLTLLNDSLYELLIIRNFDSKPHRLKVDQWAGTRFDDIFEVRGYARKDRGLQIETLEAKDEFSSYTAFRYEGLDSISRSTHIQRFYPSNKLNSSIHVCNSSSIIEVPAKGDAVLKTIISFDKKIAPEFLGEDFSKISLTRFMDLLKQRSLNSAFNGLKIQTAHAIVNRAIENAQVDIQMLLTQETPEELYPYAGIPWFSAPFGRDGIITAYQLLPWYPGVARGVLNYAFESIGKKDDPFTDEEPGKIFHELRRGEMSNTREVPFIPYYGSVDSTPLCLILLHEYFSWTKDIDSLKKWWPGALRAIDWIDRWGDIDQDGFLEYHKRSPTGLINQGWKDSHDSITHKDGVLAQSPIRLCEVQAYAYRAKMGMADLAHRLGENSLASRLRLEALQLKARFSEKFWDPVRKFIYLALDGQSNPCEVLSSNMGHCLWSNILSTEQANWVTKHLTSPSMFNGYGIRTLADTETAYNPMSYHNGSVWPHDNSLILEGFRNYRQLDALSFCGNALIQVLESSHDFRLPELFCGFRRRGNEPPIPYEVACKPQAWAAGSVFLMLKSLVGISYNPDQNTLVFNSPQLGTLIKDLEIRGLKGPDWEVDLVVRGSNHGTHVETLSKKGKVRILTIKG